MASAMQSSDDNPQIPPVNMAAKASQSGAVNPQAKWNAEPLEGNVSDWAPKNSNPHIYLPTVLITSSSNYLPEVATGEGSKFASEVESAIKRGFFATTGDRDRAMKRMTLEERRQYREAHAKQWGYDLEPIVRCEGYDDGEDIEYEMSTTASFEMRPKGF